MMRNCTIRFEPTMPLKALADAMATIGCLLKTDRRGNLVAVPACGFRHEGADLDVDYDDARDEIRCCHCRHILWPPSVFLIKQAD
ncbi:MAG: hypothetical protein KGL39_42980 [Patescibacteria group bacterium]|nr:hypothetical protein [Patescibacteria group bacterium]